MKCTYKNIIWSSGTLQITFYTWVQNRWPKTDESRVMLDHTGSQAVLLHSTPSTPWLQLLCPVSCVPVCGCVCVSSCVYMQSPCTGSVWPQLSLPLCGSPGRGWPLSILKPLQRDRGWAAEVRGVPGWPTHGCCLPGLWELGSWELR